MPAKNDDDLHGGQRSSEVKCGKLTTYMIFGEYRWGLGPKVCMHHFGCGTN